MSDECSSNSALDKLEVLPMEIADCTIKDKQIIIPIQTSYTTKAVFIFRTITFILNLSLSIIFLVLFPLNTWSNYTLLPIATIIYCIIAFIFSCYKQEKYLRLLDLLCFAISIQSITLYIFYFIPTRFKDYVNISELKINDNLEDIRSSYVAFFMFGMISFTNIFAIEIWIFIKYKFKRYGLVFLSIIFLLLNTFLAHILIENICLKFVFAISIGIVFGQIFVSNYDYVPKNELFRVFSLLIITFSMLYAIYFFSNSAVLRLYEMFFNQKWLKIKF